MVKTSDLSDVCSESQDQDILNYHLNMFDSTHPCLDSIEPLDPKPLGAKAGVSTNLKKTRSCSAFEKKTLSMFIDKNNRSPKKEYIRCQIIRGVKRAMRDSRSLSRLPVKKLHSVDSQCFESVEAWRDFTETVKINQNFVSMFSSTESGPLTDGKSSRKYQSNEKSYNDRFCFRFFTEIMKTDIYSHFLLLIFTPFTCKSLCLKFNFRPVGHSTKACSPDCRSKWEAFRDYVSSKMIEDLRPREREVP
jgi:hypothetical protein